MGKVILTYNEVIELNHLLEEKGLSFKLHLHDACGSQSFTLESLSDDSIDGNIDDMKSFVIKYFEEKRIQIRFLESNLEFIIVQ